MKTWHKIVFGNSKNLSYIEPGSVNLMITSPPYPMIEMWDEVFAQQNPNIKRALESKDKQRAFDLMHLELDKVWNETYRVLKEGGIACINIGDATRTIDGVFQLHSNHARILQHCTNIGFNNLPTIIWRKQTNAPNKFMGSGMLPAGAYVTLEHEYILILRKGGKREFKVPESSAERREGAFFWEERNNWFSDVWTDLKGIAQTVNGDKTRGRSAAYPFELAYRLINMYSCKNDIVLDPYLGTGTTTVAAMTAQRNSIGVEIDPRFQDSIVSRINGFIPNANAYILERMSKHADFVIKRAAEKGDLKYINKPHGFPVMTRQEVDTIFNKLSKIESISKNNFEVLYNKLSDSDLERGRAVKIKTRSQLDVESRKEVDLFV